MQRVPQRYRCLAQNKSHSWLRSFPARFHCRILLIFFASLLADNALASSDCDSDDASRQSIFGFNTLIDGQPGTAGQPSASLTFSSDSYHASELVGSYGFTPGPRKEECDALISFLAPALSV